VSRREESRNLHELVAERRKKRRRRSLAGEFRVGKVEQEESDEKEA
jgi:hypothetical protein